MWSDSIFSTLTSDQQKLFLLANLVRTVYSSGPKGPLPPNLSDLTVITNDLTLGPILSIRIDGQKTILFAGTNSPTQLAQQIAGAATPSIYPGGAVNSYMLGLADSAFLLLPNDATLFAGHSLGGAMAWLTATTLKGLGRPIAGVVTYGCPRPFSLSSLPQAIWPLGVNIWNKYDPVPIIPPDGFGLYNWGCPGNFVEVHGDHTLTTGAAPNVSGGELAILFASETDSWHAIGTYVGLLKTGGLVVPMVGPSPPPVKVVHMANQLVQFKVLAVQNGQAIVNDMHFRADDASGHMAIATSLRDNWRTNVLSMVTADQQVIRYEYRRVASIVFKDNTNPALGSLYRYDNVIKLAGVGADVGQAGTAGINANLPTQVAVGVTKSGAGWTGADFVTPPVIPQKQARGSMRICGLLESDTQIDGNKLEVAIRDLWQSRVDSLVNWAGLLGGIPAQMALLTNRTGKSVLTDPGPPVVPIWYASLVTSGAVNPYVTSQNSRKQSLSRLG